MGGAPRFGLHSPRQGGKSMADRWGTNRRLDRFGNVLVDFTFTMSVDDLAFLNRHANAREVSVAHVIRACLKAAQARGEA